MKKETLSIHAGYETDPTTKSVAVPIYQTVAYEFDDAQHISRKPEITLLLHHNYMVALIHYLLMNYLV